MTILPDTIYKYQYEHSILLTRTFTVPLASGYWASDIQCLSGNAGEMYNWEFESCVKTKNVTILECYDKTNYPEMYI